MTLGSHPESAPDARRRLWECIRKLSLQRGRFVLSSGATSDYYLDLRRTTTDPEGAFLASGFLAREATVRQAVAVGGPTLGADPLVGSTVALSHGSSAPLRGFIVRAQKKEHGAGRRIEGHLAAGDRVLVFDDVVTSAGSLLAAIEAVQETGADVVAAWCLVDREGGGRERLAQAGIELTAVFQVGEILADSLGAADGQAATAGSASAKSGTGRVHWQPETPHLAVDAILELVPDHVLLIERKNPPHGWALPGGFVDPGESLEQAVQREIREETGLRLEHWVQMHTYSNPHRDPRFHTVSTIFVATAHGEVAAADDASEARLFPLDALPSDLCFDHAEVLADFCTGRWGVRPGRLH